MANPTTGSTGTGLDTIIDDIWADTGLDQQRLASRTSSPAPRPPTR